MNHYERLQKPLCYHYTIFQYKWSMWELNPRLTILHQTILTRLVFLPTFLRVEFTSQG
nr:MAG TPA: hypothetical protein [Caudoviricetes sp.]